MLSLPFMGRVESRSDRGGEAAIKLRDAEVPPDTSPP
jgi:hypothetical protein